MTFEFPIYEQSPYEGRSETFSRYDADGTVWVISHWLCLQQTGHYEYWTFSALQYTRVFENTDSIILDQPNQQRIFQAALADAERFVAKLVTSQAFQPVAAQPGSVPSTAVPPTQSTPE